jgi:hypothetical protein
MEMFTSGPGGDEMHSAGLHGQRQLIWAGVSTG